MYRRTFPSRINMSEIGLSPEIGNEISKSRIEMLTDGIFAIVMTLLVLEIAVPQLTHPQVAAGELPKRLLELWPVIYSYALSFIILGFFWINHHDQFIHQ
jgi:TMEM175 potassium channel family protein